jgi:hypothetical protein
MFPPLFFAIFVLAFPKVLPPRVLSRGMGAAPERRGRGFLGCYVAVMVLALLVGVSAEADDGLAIDDTYRGIFLKVVPADPAAESDIPLVTSEAAMSAMKNALDLIYEQSPFNAAALEQLKKAGDVVIIYDPGFPEWSRGDLTLAAFLPDFFEPAEDAPGSNVFVAMLGRYIMKHEAAEIAAEGIVHELVGHGVQHMHGRLENLNGLNIECEASLYEMQAFQDLGVDLFSGYMVRFRRELEEHHCDDFKRFMRKRKAWLMPLWDEAPMDVTQLLALFEDYLAQLPN